MITRTCPICTARHLDEPFTATGTPDQVTRMIVDHITDTDTYPHDKLSLAERLAKETVR